MDENNAKTKTATLFIPEISDEKMRELIVNNLQKIQGVSDLNVDAQHNKMEITFDPTISSLSQFKNLITQLGSSVQT